jgi:hypothetical protein
MIIFLKKRLHLLSLAICFIANHVEAQSRAQFNAREFNTRSVQWKYFLPLGARVTILLAPALEHA